MADIPLSTVPETTDNIEASDLLLLQKSAGGDILRGKQKEIVGTNQVPQISLTTETTYELNLLNGINTNFVINLAGSTQTAISFTFEEPLNSDKKVAKNVYFRIKPHPTNNIDISFPNASPTFVKFINGFSSTKTITAGSGGASETHYLLKLEGGWSIGRIAQLS